jgi:hypothetical protein
MGGEVLRSERTRKGAAIKQALGISEATVAASPEQLHELLKYCMDFGKAMLEDSGEFCPFGAVIGPDGKLKAVGGYDGNERPKSQDIYRLLSDALTSEARAGNVLAIALAADVNIPSHCQAPSPDGLRVHLETEGYSRFIYVPYTLAKTGFFKKTTIATYGEPISVDVQPQAFTRPNG